MTAFLRSGRSGKGSREDSAPPTFVVPPGSEINVDAAGHVNLRAPGNLVLQASGVFGSLDAGGSIRIEARAQIEALEVRCGDTCYVEGSLTAWRVRARELHVESRAHARIVLREVDQLQVGAHADLVGNFSSEDELMMLFSRYAGQLRQLPSFARRFGNLTAPPHAAAPLAGFPEGALLTPPPGSGSPASGSDRLLDELPEHLLLALALLRKERASLEGPARAALDRLLEHLAYGDTAALAREGAVLLDVLPGDRERINRARKLLARYVVAG